jgi:hypothetical protein
VLFGLTEEDQDTPHRRTTPKSNRPLWGKLVLFGGVGVLNLPPSSDDFVSIAELKVEFSKSAEDPMTSLRSLHGDGNENRHQSNSKIWTNALEKFGNVQSPSCAFSALEIESSSSGTVTIGGLQEFLEESGDLSRACAASLLALLVQQKGVAEIHHRPPIFKSNGQAKMIIQTESLSSSSSPYSCPYTDAGIDGNGQIVGVADTGVDELSCFFRNSDSSLVTRSSYLNPTFDLSKRKVIQYINYCDDRDTSYGHGTHVSGTVVGQDLYLTQYSGHGNGAKIAFFDMEYSSSPELGLFHPDPFGETVLTPAHGAGAFIHTNSWGTSWNLYDDRVLSIDSFSIDHPNSLVLFAAGNDGREGYYSIGSPGVSKNALTVGATEFSSGDINTVAYFSSLGPTFDNRIKPDVVAPGDQTPSAAADSDSESCSVCDKAGTSVATAAVGSFFNDFFISQLRSLGWLHKSEAILQIRRHTIVVSSIPRIACWTATPATISILEEPPLRHCSSIQENLSQNTMDWIPKNLLPLFPPPQTCTR